MNRRSFGKLAGLLGLTPLVGYAPRGEEMRFGDLLGKMAKGETLTPSEVLWVQRLGNEQQLQVSRINPILDQSGGLDGGELKRKSIETPPLQSAFFLSSMQSIQDSTTTPIVWDGAAFNTWGPMMKFNSATPDRILFPNTSKDVGLVLWGHVRFAANSSGTRYVNVGDDAGGGYTVAEIQAATGGKETAFSWIMPWRLQAATTYMDVRVRQHSGAALNLLSAAFGVMRLA